MLRILEFYQTVTCEVCFGCRLLWLLLLLLLLLLSLVLLLLWLSTAVGGYGSTEDALQCVDWQIG